MAGVRLAFVLAVALRFWGINDFAKTSDASRLALEGPLLIAALVASVAMGLFATTRGVSFRYLDCSVTLDAIIACSTLLPGVLFPWPSYQGLLVTPDFSVLPALCISAGLRMSERAAVLGAACNMVFAGALVALDLRLNAATVTYTMEEVHLYSLYLLAASAVGVTISYRARLLATTAAAQAERAERAHAGLVRVLHDNHDVGSLLSSARINADLLARAHATHGDELATHASLALRSNLSELTAAVAGHRDQAYVELASTAERSGASFDAAFDVVVPAVRRRFPSVNVAVSGSLSDAHVLVAGGQEGLERLLLNVLVNAAQGDGKRVAHGISVSGSEDERDVTLQVDDDGPGFPPHVLAHVLERIVTTKPDGSGLGLTLVRRIVHASAGTLSLVNLTIGARVVVVLPRT